MWREPAHRTSNFKEEEREGIQRTQIIRVLLHSKHAGAAAAVSGSGRWRVPRLSIQYSISNFCIIRWCARREMLVKGEWWWWGDWGTRWWNRKGRWWWWMGDQNETKTIRGRRGKRYEIQLRVHTGTIRRGTTKYGHETRNTRRKKTSLFCVYYVHFICKAIENQGNKREIMTMSKKAKWVIGIMRINI